jgi:hypothetical protein
MKKVVKAVLAAASLLAASHAFAGGAIVIDEQDGPQPTNYFVSVKHAQKDAARTALAQCRAQGHDSCLVAVRFEQCAALADSSRFYRVGKGATIAEASSNALKNCPGCAIVQAACDGTRVASR